MGVLEDAVVVEAAEDEAAADEDEAVTGADEDEAVTGADAAVEAAAAVDGVETAAAAAGVVDAAGVEDAAIMETRIVTPFFDAFSHIYKRVCLSVRWSVGPSVTHELNF